MEKRCQPPEIGKLRTLLRHITQIWWLAPFLGSVGSSFALVVAVFVIATL